MQHGEKYESDTAYLAGSSMRLLSTREVLEQAHSLLSVQPDQTGGWISDEWWDLVGEPDEIIEISACSVGAMVLAKALYPFELNAEAVGETNWDEYVASDPAFGRALRRLLDEIATWYPAWLENYAEDSFVPGVNTDEISMTSIVNCIVKWNDYEERTVEDVNHLFEQAIKAEIADDEKA